MKKFEFKGDWKTEIELNLLSEFNNKRFFEYDEKSHERLLNRKVPIEFFDELNNSPDPYNSQLNTINYILENQQSIITSVYKRIRDVEYPLMKEQIDITDYWFPKIDTEEDLKGILGIISIQVLVESKNNFSYFILNFYSSYENEHGIHLLFHRNEILDSGNAWEYNLELICKDTGIDFEKRIEEINDVEDSILHLIEPHEKYNTLKPREFNANEGLPYRLIRNFKNEKLLKLINEGIFDIDYNAHSYSFLATAIQSENIEIVEYLLSKKVKNLNSVEFQLSNSKNKKIIKKVNRYIRKDKNWLTKLWN